MNIKSPGAQKLVITALVIVILIYTFRALENLIFAGGISGTLSLMLDALSVVGYLLLFFVVTYVPSPVGARTAGYIWIIMDITATTMPLYGVPFEAYTALRFGGAHIATAIWMGAVSYQYKGVLLVVGLPLSAYLIAYSFLQVFLPAGVLEPLFSFLILWFILLLYRLEQKS